MSNEKPTVSDEMFSVARGRWTDLQIMRTIHFLDAISSTLGSTAAEDLAATLRVVLLGKAPTLLSCPTCVDIEAKYPVLCGPCATKMGPMTPQKMIFMLQEDEKIVWAACVFSTVFVPKAYGKDNTIVEVESLLDQLNNDSDIDGMVKLLSMDNGNGGYKQ